MNARYETTSQPPFETSVPMQRERLSFDAAIAEQRRRMGQHAAVVRRIVNGRQCATVTQGVARPDAQTDRRRQRHVQALDDLRRAELALIESALGRRTC